MPNIELPIRKTTLEKRLVGHGSSYKHCLFSLNRFQKAKSLSSSENPTNSVASDVIDIITSERKGNKKQEDKRIKCIRKAASDQVLEKIFQKQQEISCKKCEVSGKELEVKQHQTICQTVLVHYTDMIIVVV